MSLRHAHHFVRCSFRVPSERLRSPSRARPGGGRRIGHSTEGIPCAARVLYGGSGQRQVLRRGASSTAHCTRELRMRDPPCLEGGRWKRPCHRERARNQRGRALYRTRHAGFRTARALPAKAQNRTSGAAKADHPSGCRLAGRSRASARPWAWRPRPSASGTTSRFVSTIASGGLRCLGLADASADQLNSKRPPLG